MKRIAIALAFVASVIVPIASSAHPAFAEVTVACSGVRGGPAWTWVRTQYDVRGVRAPIQARNNGSLCGAPGDGNFAFNAAWIAIQDDPNFGNGIAQIGYEHDFGNNGDHFCRFYGTGSGVRHDYKCSDSNGTTIFFKIRRQCCLGNGNHYESISDCGTSGGYSNCTEEVINPAFNNPIGAIASEVNWRCPIQIMGADIDKQNIGTSNNPVQGSTDDGSTWSTRSWGFTWGWGSSTCQTNDYGHSAGPDAMQTWDTRNSN